MVLLMAAFGAAAASHIVALPLVALLGLAAMLWVAEGRRSQVLPVVLIAAVGGMLQLGAPGRAVSPPAGRGRSVAEGSAPCVGIWSKVDR